MLPAGNPLTPPPHPDCPSLSHQQRNAGKNHRTCSQGTTRPHTALYDRHLRHLLTHPRPRDLVSIPLTLSHGKTMPKFLAMTSSHLGKGRDSPNGNQDPCH